MTTTSYLVTWEIDIEADSPEGAVREALRVQRDPYSIATVFTATDTDGNTTHIDLLTWEEQ